MDEPHDAPPEKSGEGNGGAPDHSPPAFQVAQCPTPPVAKIPRPTVEYTERPVTSVLIQHRRA
jgi:hypothetical protein